MRVLLISVNLFWILHPIRWGALNKRDIFIYFTILISRSGSQNILEFEKVLYLFYLPLELFLKKPFLFFLFYGICSGKILNSRRAIIGVFLDFILFASVAVVKLLIR